MNKEDIYRLIGYQGEYSTSVKKAIRKLLKDNHPDNKGNREKFELINEVKKELELGKVSYDFKNKNVLIKNITDIDYEYCYQMINCIKKKRDNTNNTLMKKQDILLSYEHEYKTLYQDSLDLESYLLTNSPYLKRIKMIKYISIFLTLVMIITFLISILRDNKIFLVIFIVSAIICLIIIENYLYLMHDITLNNKKRLSYYIKVNSSLKKNISKQNVIKKDIRELKKEINHMENDLRFYQNLLK